MIKKFTESQYKTLIEAQSGYFPTSIFYESGEDIPTVNKALQEYDEHLWDFILANELENEAIALMNPISRPYVKDDLVLKEDKYYWLFESKTISKHNGNWLLNQTPKNSDVFMFTESEINASPFDINKFTSTSSFKFYN